MLKKVGEGGGGGGGLDPPTNYAPVFIAQQNFIFRN